MTAQELWNSFAQGKNLPPEYEAWAFGDDADVLAQLVLDGTKTATASAHILYESENLPRAGEYSVILNSLGEAVCIVQTEKVFVVPFDEVDAEQAWKEGEGDRSLFYWRQVHERFFCQELAVAGLEFDEKMNVVCEQFRRVW